VRCAGCGQENRKARKFCAECGTPLAAACPACGMANEPGEKFCGECGASLRDSSLVTRGSSIGTGDSSAPIPVLRATSSEPRATSPLSYTPKHLADKILQSKSALEGERKQLTVLFADVKGSMELAEQLDPEEWHAILDRFFAILTDGVHRFEGTVNQYTGDGIMALFGAREKIAGRMVLLDLGFADALPLIFDFLGVADPQRPAPQLDPDARQRQILAVMRKVIQSISEEQPTVTLVEDLHWLDDASGEFLAHMVDARHGSRNLLLLNFRPEYRAEWMQKSWYRQIPLTPLGKEAIAELLADLLGTDPSIATLARPIHARTGGNPFFTEEVAQTLIESGHLQGERGAYRLVTPIEKLAVPATVQAVLAARIDRLPEREKRLLQTASVIGKDFPEPLLAEVAELPAGELKASLAALHRAEFIHEQALYPVVEYSFKHPLTQDVALGSQLKERRRQVHAAVAQAIEQQHPEHLDERAPLLAHHWEESGEALSAARWHRRAAEWAGRTDFAAATHHWGRVRALLRDLSNDREAAALGIAACMQLLNVSWRVGTGLDEASALLEEGQTLANAIGDRRAHLYLSMVYGRARCSDGDVVAYLALAIENRRAALEIDDIAVQANAWMYLADALAFGARRPGACAPAPRWAGGPRCRRSCPCQRGCTDRTHGSEDARARALRVARRVRHRARRSRDAHAIAAGGSDRLRRDRRAGTCGAAGAGSGRGGPVRVGCVTIPPVV